MRAFALPRPAGRDVIVMSPRHLLVALAILVGGLLLAPAAGLAQTNAPLVDLTAAVRATVERNYGIRVEKFGVEFGEGQLTEAEGDFDWTLVSSAGILRERLPPLPPYVFGTDTQNWAYSLGVQKKLRQGMLLTTSLGTDSLKDPDLTGPHWATRGAVNFEMLVPLARGAGEESAAANELFARKDRDSRYALYRHQIASGVLDTVTAFWECVGATRSLHILRESEQEAEEMEATVVRLADASLFSLAYVEQAQSNSRSKKTRRVNAELDQYKARQTLGVSMGMNGIDLVAPPLPGQEFPEMEAPQMPDGRDFARVIRFAQDRREDLRAAQSSREALAMLTNAARRDLKPRLDLSLQLSYDGIDRGQRPQAFLFNDRDGLRVMGAVEMEFPLRNRVQSGQLRQRLAEEEQAGMLRERLAQEIASEVMVALEEVSSTYAAYQVSLEAERYFAEALAKERKRFLVGDSSFIDVVTLQDGHRDAQLETIAALQAHLVALATLRFASGTLVEGNDAAGTVAIDQLTKIPHFE
jgi:outer membrane protein